MRIDLKYMQKDLNLVPLGWEVTTAASISIKNIQTTNGFEPENSSSLGNRADHSTINVKFVVSLESNHGPLSHIPARATNFTDCFNHSATQSGQRNDYTLKNDKKVFLKFCTYSEIYSTIENRDKMFIR